MDEESQINELLIKEYAEAGQAARQHEQLTRTSVSVLLPALIFLAGYIFNAEIGINEKIGFSVAGFLISLLVLNIIHRHRLYYRSYMERAHVIEKTIRVNGNQIVSLYTMGANAAKGSYTISNKTAFSLFFILTASIFFFSALSYAVRALF